MKCKFVYAWMLFILTACSVQRVAEPPLQLLPSNTAGISDSFQLEINRFFPDRYLIRLIDSAVRRNTDINIALQRLLVAQANLSARRAALLPGVEAAVGAGAERYGEYTMNGVGNFDTNLSQNIDKEHKIPVSPTTDLFVGLRSSWEIDIWGKLRHLRNAALNELLASRAGTQWLVTNVVAAVAQDYYQLITLDAELEIVQRNIRLQEEALEIVKAQKAGGRATELAVQQFNAQVLNTRSISYRLQQDRIALENELNSLMGRYPQPVDRDTLPEPALQQMPATVPVGLLSRRPDLREAELSLMATRENMAAARAAFLPSLVIRPYVGLNAFTPALLLKDGSGVYGIVAGLTAPLFQQRLLRTQYAIANASNAQAVYNYQQNLFRAYSEATTNISAMSLYQQAYRQKQQEVNELKSAVVTARDLYMSGYANYLEVITAQKSVLEAELDMVRQRRDILSAAVDLYRSLGGGWPTAVQP